MNSIHVRLSDNNALETFILRIAMLLRLKPRLLCALLGSGYRLEHSDTVDEVRFFVLVGEKSSRFFWTVSVDLCVRRR